MKNLFNLFLTFVLMVALVLFVQQRSSATVYTFSSALDGLQEVPANASTGLGQISGTYDDVSLTLSFQLSFTGLTGTTIAAHFHGPAAIGVNAGVQIALGGFPLGVVSGSYSNVYVLTPAQSTDLLNGLWYINIHTNIFPGGEIRSQLQEFNAFQGQASLRGINEVPVNASNGIGAIYWILNPVSNQLQFQVSFTGLTGVTTAAHFHGPAGPGFNAGVQIGFIGFPLGVTTGVYTNTYILTPAQSADFQAGLWYVNIHSAVFPGGEIRAQMTEGTLPVELSSFTASVLKNTVTLNWSTIFEKNNSGFEVERKAVTSNEWSKVGQVSANELKKYSFKEIVETGSYNYRLKQIDFNGNFEYFNLTSEVNVGLPNSFSMSQNYPNPFNPTTKIDYELPFEGKVNMILYDISGKKVLTLINEVKSAGYYTIQINAENLSSGVYFYKILAQGREQNFSMTKMLSVVK